MPVPSSKLGFTISLGPVGLVGVGVGVLEEDVGVGVSVLDEEYDDEIVDEELSVESADETMVLEVEIAVDEKLDETVGVVETRVSIAKPKRDQRGLGSGYLRPTIDFITAACAILRALEIAMPGSLTTHVACSYTLHVICTCFIAALEADGVESGEITAEIIGIALQGKSTAISTRIRATVILGAGVACWIACGTSRVVWRGGRASRDNGCADHVCTGYMSICIQSQLGHLLGLRRVQSALQVAVLTDVTDSYAVARYSADLHAAREC